MLIFDDVRDQKWKNERNRSLRIDLAQFKLHIRLKPKTELTLHFDSPSRRFYLSVIALVVSEMKRLGQITSIPLEAHADQLILLNETVGDSAGSSEKENLIPRIYKKWKDALPDLENAPLFKVMGRKKEEDGTGRTYRFSEAEKDTWANLFEYKGSEEHVRLRFSIDKLGASLDDVVIVYEDSRDGDAWERFISSLKAKSEEKSSISACRNSPGSTFSCHAKRDARERRQAATPQERAPYRRTVSYTGNRFVSDLATYRAEPQG